MLSAVVKLHGYGVRPVPFLVDTGADTTILSFQDAKEIGLEVTLLKRAPTPAKGIGGTLSLHLVEATLLFASERTQKIYEMEIGIPAENYGLPSLLGRDILNEWSMRYRAGRAGDGTLEFSVDDAGPNWP